MVMKNNPDLDRAVKGIRNTRDRHFEVARMIAKAGDAKMLVMDILAFSAIKRSLSLSSGFCQMVEQKNYVCAAPLIRLQVDSCLRFYATTLVEDAESLASNFINGVKVSLSKDRHGNALTDRYLVKSLSAYFPWIETVYAQSSGFVHFSEKHFHSTFVVGSEYGHFTAMISEADEKIDGGYFLELAQAFLAATDLLLEFMDRWVVHKESMKTIHSRQPCDQAL